MLRWALIFLIVALVAAVLGFGVLVGVASEIAKILFFIFIALSVIAFVTSRLGGPKTRRKR